MLLEQLDMFGLRLKGVHEFHLNMDLNSKVKAKTAVSPGYFLYSGRVTVFYLPWPSGFVTPSSPDSRWECGMWG